MHQNPNPIGQHNHPNASQSNQKRMDAAVSISDWCHSPATASKQPLAKLEEILEVYERFLCHTMPHYATSRHITPHHPTSIHTKRHLHQLATTRGIGSTPDPLLRRLQGISRTADLKHVWSDFGTAVNLTAWSWKDLNWISTPHVSRCKFGPPKFKNIQNRTTWSLLFDCQFTSNPNLSGRTWCFIRDTESEPE